MPRDPFIREKFTKERSAARKAIREYYKRFPNKRYQTELESWRHLQSQNFEFVMKRLREPVESGGYSSISRSFCATRACCTPASSILDRLRSTGFHALRSLVCSA